MRAEKNEVSLIFQIPHATRARRFILFQGVERLLRLGEHDALAIGSLRHPDGWAGGGGGWDTLSGDRETISALVCGLILISWFLIITPSARASVVGLTALVHRYWDGAPSVVWQISSRPHFRESVSSFNLHLDPGFLRLSKVMLARWVLVMGG